MSDLQNTELWFRRAVPNPTQQNVSVQLGCHFEEVAEMLNELASVDSATTVLILQAQERIHALAEVLKKQAPEVIVKSRKDLLDSISDQQVTGIGCAYMLGMNGPEALARTNTSNWSKFDDNGQPIFNENGKIAKGPNYKVVDLTGLY